MRIHKHMVFEERKLNSEFIDHDSIKKVEDHEKKKLYYLLVQLNFLSFQLNITPEIKFHFKNVDKDNIKSDSLKSLLKQENLLNCKSDYFTTFNTSNGLKMVYLDNKCYIKVFDVFNRRILKTILGTNDEEILLV